MRVQAITKPSSSNPNYILDMIEDQFATGARTFGEPAETDHDDPGEGLDTPPPSASWDTTLLAPDGLEVATIIGNGGQLLTTIHGAVIFGDYDFGQVGRIYTTEPGGIELLSPLRLQPDANNKAEFTWPVAAEGEYQFCIETYNLRNETNGTKVCASLEVVFSESGANAVTINGVLVTQNGAIMTQT
jgi:hypothetical protein